MDRPIGFVTDLHLRGGILFADIQVTDLDAFEKHARVCIGTIMTDPPKILDMKLSAGAQNVFGFQPSKSKIEVPFAGTGRLSGTFEVTEDMLAKIREDYYDRKMRDGYLPPVVIDEE